MTDSQPRTTCSDQARSASARSASLLHPSSPRTCEQSPARRSSHQQPNNPWRPNKPRRSGSSHAQTRDSRAAGSATARHPSAPPARRHAPTASGASQPQCNPTRPGTPPQTPSPSPSADWATESPSTQSRRPRPPPEPPTGTAARHKPRNEPPTAEERRTVPTPNLSEPAAKAYRRRTLPPGTECVKYEGGSEPCISHWTSPPTDSYFPEACPPIPSNRGWEGCWDRSKRCEP